MKEEFKQAITIDQFRTLSEEARIIVKKLWTPKAGDGYWHFSKPEDQDKEEWNLFYLPTPVEGLPVADILPRDSNYQILAFPVVTIAFMLGIFIDRHIIFSCIRTENNDWKVIIGEDYYIEQQLCDALWKAFQEHILNIRLGE